MNLLPAILGVVLLALTVLAMRVEELAAPLLVVVAAAAVMFLLIVSGTVPVA